MANATALTTSSDATRRLPRKRRVVLDVARSMAILCVVLVHCAEKTYLPTGALEYGGYWGFAILHYLGRIGVPLFLFLTGTLVASKRFDTERDVLSFYKRSFLPLLLVTEVWCLIYVAFLYLYYGVFDPAHTVAYMLFLKQLPDLLPHWWYLPMIVGVYGVLPFVGLVLQKAPRKALLVPFAIILIYIFVVPTYNDFAEATGIRQLPVPISLDLAFYGGIYGFYVMLGYLIDRCAIVERIPTRVLAAIFVVAIVPGMLGEYLGVDTWYDSIFILVDSIVVFELLLRWERAHSEPNDRPPSGAARLVGWVSGMSFAVYLVHELVLAPIPRGLVPGMPLAAEALVLVAIVFSLSLAVVAIVRKVPHVGKALFLQKG